MTKFSSAKNTLLIQIIDGLSPGNPVNIHKRAHPGTIQLRAVQPTLSDCSDLQ